MNFSAYRNVTARTRPGDSNLQIGYNMASLRKCNTKLQKRKERMTDNSITTIQELMQTVPSPFPTPHQQLWRKLLHMSIVPTNVLFIHSRHLDLRMQPNSQPAGRPPAPEHSPTKSSRIQAWRQNRRLWNQYAWLRCGWCKKQCSSKAGCKGGTTSVCVSPWLPCVQLYLRPLVAWGSHQALHSHPCHHKQRKKPPEVRKILCLIYRTCKQIQSLHPLQVQEPKASTPVAPTPQHQQSRENHLLLVGDAAGPPKRGGRTPHDAKRLGQHADVIILAGAGVHVSRYPSPLRWLTF